MLVWGFLLSAYDDSTIISKCMNNFSKEKYLYTLGFDEKSFDESKYIKNFDEFDTTIFKLSDREYR